MQANVDMFHWEGAGEQKAVVNAAAAAKSAGGVLTTCTDHLYAMLGHASCTSNVLQPSIQLSLSRNLCFA